MSKIPQGDWNAIAARYQDGESISKIARSYGCTPPAIHYVLKRNRLRPTEVTTPLVQIPPVETTQTRLVRANTANGPPAAASHVEKFGNDTAGPTVVRTTVPNPSMPSAPAAACPDPAAAISPEAPLPNLPGFTEQPPHRDAAPPMRLPGLDRELRLRAEAAIELFRSSFEAALADGSPTVRERLRQAASDLMRVAARTTIVLDRLNTIPERSTHPQNYPRSAHAGEAFGKLG